MKHKIGIAFEGGGGKGAYQIGVWKAMKEAGIDSYVKAVAGTSVGGLNAAMFVQGDYDRAESIWSNIEPSHVLKLNIGLKSFFTDENLSNLIDRSIKSMDIFDKSKVTCWITASRKSDDSESFETDFSGDTVKYKESNAHYFNIKKYSSEDRKKLLLATSALPVVFPSQRVVGDRYRDGGLADNTPLKALVNNEDCDIIIVIHLNQTSSKHFDIKIEEAVNKSKTVLEIFPKENQGNILTGTLNFTKKSAKRRILQGYNENIEMFCAINEILSSNSDDKIIRSSLNENIKDNESADVFSKEIDSFLAECSENEINMLKLECISLLNENKNRAIQIRKVKPGKLNKFLRQNAKNQNCLNLVLYKIERQLENCINSIQKDIDILKKSHKALLQKVDRIDFIQKCSVKKNNKGILYKDCSELERIAFISHNFAEFLIADSTENKTSDDSKPFILFSNAYIECRDKAIEELELDENYTLKSLFEDKSYENIILPVDIKNLENNNTELSEFCTVLIDAKNGKDLNITYDKEIVTVDICDTLICDYLNLILNNNQVEEQQEEFDIKQIRMIEQNSWQIGYEFDVPKFKVAYEKYHNNAEMNLTRKRDTISQECMDFIIEHCERNSGIFNKKKVKGMDADMANAFVYHNDTQKTDLRGFAITSKGIVAIIDDEKEQHLHIKFSEIADIKRFKEYEYCAKTSFSVPNPLNPRKVLIGHYANKEKKLLPYRYVNGNGDKDTIIEFLETIRNACWVDLYIK